jgi:hypothetical protein
MLQIQAQFVKRGKAVGRGDTIDIIRPQAKDVRFRLAKMIARGKIEAFVEGRGKRGVGQQSIGRWLRRSRLGWAV